MHKAHNALKGGLMRIFIDSFVMKLAVRKYGVDGVKERLNKLIDDGNILVATEASAIDNVVFRRNVDWYKQMSAKGSIITEIYQGNPGDTASGINAMVNKRFQWSSYDGMETNWSGEFTDLAKLMADNQRLLKLYRAVLKYALPKGQWEMGPWKTAKFFTDDQIAELGLEQSQVGNRSLVFDAMKQHGYSMDVYAAYTREYLGGLTSQHMCDDVALIDEI